MNYRTLRWLLPLISAVLCLAACSKEEKCTVTEPSIVPGVGVNTGNGAVCLGNKASTTRKALGSTPVTEDMGGLGVRFSYSQHNLSGLFSGNGKNSTVTAIYLRDGIGVRTAGGVGLGSTEAEVTAEFGSPVVDPFLGAWVYRSAGIAFQFTNGAVSRIQLFKPAEN
jgi:hypothetical protein